MPNLFLFFFVLLKLDEDQIQGRISPIRCHPGDALRLKAQVFKVRFYSFGRGGYHCALNNIVDLFVRTYGRVSLRLLYS